jgi:hypothetical protein
MSAVLLKDVFGSVKNRTFFPQPSMDGFTGGPENIFE